MKLSFLYYLASKVDAVDKDAVPQKLVSAREKKAELPSSGNLSKEKKRLTALADCKSSSHKGLWVSSCLNSVEEYLLLTEESTFTKAVRRQKEIVEKYSHHTLKPDFPEMKDTFQLFPDEKCKLLGKSILKSAGFSDSEL